MRSVVTSLIRPPDPQISGATLGYGPYSSAEATRRICHLAFRDAHTVLDLTWSKGNFWRDPLPPGLNVTGNQMPGCPRANEKGSYSPENPKCACGCLHVDFTASGLPPASWDLTVYDPPHIADGGVWFLEWSPDEDTRDSLVTVMADSREHLLALGEAILEAARTAPAYVVQDR